MADETNTEKQAASEADPAPPKPQPKQRKPKTSNSTAKTASDKNAAKASGQAGRKVAKYTHAERTRLLQSIEGMLRAGTHKLKDAVKNVGIGEQTYYNWKKAADAPGAERSVVRTSSDELQDLLKLEEENQRLRKVLAEKLRAENTELRKRLGME